MRSPLTTWRKVFNLLGIAVAVGVTAALIVLIGIVYLSAQQSYEQAQAGPPPPPIEYDQLVYSAEKTVLCPGDQLNYTSSLKINRRAIIWYVENWYSLDLRVSVGPEDTPHYRNIPGPSAAVFTKRRRSVVIPKLPPGKYEYRFGMTDSQSTPSIHSVLFTVPPNCEK